MSMTDLPTPIHHRPVKRIDPRWAHSKGKIVLRCIECGHEQLSDPGNGFERCWECSQPKERKAP